MYFKYCVIFLLLGTFSVHARQNYSEQGIITYKKLCKTCHGNPYKGAAMLKKKEWKGLFKNEDKKMLEIHRNNQKAMNALSTSYYKNRHRHLVEFLISSASDSGVIPSCDGNFCGN